MNRHLPAAVAMALSLAALVVVFARTGANTPSVDDPRPPEELRALKDEIRALVASMKGVKSSVESMQEREPAAGARDPAVEAQLADISQKVDLISRRIAEIEAKLGTRVADPAVPPPADTAATLQAQVTDATKPARERVLALAKLRAAAPDSRAAVVESMAELLGTSQDAGIRAEVIRHMHGVDSPVLKQAVLRALATDADARVREQAAKDLDTWRGEAEVRAELETAKSSDSSEKVRKNAAKTLEDD